MNWINFIRQILFGDYQVWVFGFILGMIASFISCFFLVVKTKLSKAVKIILIILVFVLVLFCMRQIHFLWEDFQAWSTTPLGPPLQLTPGNIIECPGGICPGDYNPFLDAH
ncbi:MAG: hypothetical protein GX428_05175 [Candidatus Atribacteria bacterium]|nr:hypothetical protein [Candidatus Atribacteria bacterium]